jgi:membrane-associated phospholipid phosphatase
VSLLVLFVVPLAAASLQALWAWGQARRLAPNSVGASVAGIPPVARGRSSLGRWLAACRHPAAATALALCIAVVVSVLGWLLVGALAFLVRTQRALLELDSGVADWGSTHATNFSTAALEAITLLGDTRVVMGLAALVVIAEVVRGPETRVVVFLIAVIAGNHLITSAVKDLVDRARPALNPIAHTLGPSFPSGHSSTAAAFYTAAAVILARRHGRAGFTAFTSLAAGIAVAVACTRVLLDVHWLSDVIAGLALGWAWVTLCVVVLGDQLLTTGRPMSRLRFRGAQRINEEPRADVDPGVVEHERRN